MNRILRAAVAAPVLLSLAAAAEAAVVRVSDAGFPAPDAVVTFSEHPVGTQNPRYAGLVEFSSMFTGQVLTSDGCPGFLVATCVIGDPQNLLLLEPRAGAAVIMDGAVVPTAPFLVGGASRTGPIAMRFAEDQRAVGFSLGGLEGSDGVDIAVFARDGSTLGTFATTAFGEEFFGLAAEAGGPLIGGVLLQANSGVLSLYGVDTLSFVGAQEEGAEVPAPAAAPLLAAALAALGLLRRRGA